MDQEKIKTFVISQLKAGLSTEEITTQLRAAQWTDEAIEAAFAAARDQLAPTPPPSPPPSPQQAADSSTDTSQEINTSLQQESAATSASTPQTVNMSPSQPTAAETLPPPSGRGTFRTGLKLFTQSVRIMRNNPGLLRYAIFSTVLTVLIVMILAIVMIVDSSRSGILFSRTVDEYGSSTDPTLLGSAVLAIAVYFISVIVAFYGVATSSHALAIFRGEPGSHKDHIAKARKKLPAILIFSLVNIVVGYILSFIERIRLIGWLISKIFGTVWKLSTSFALPIIADTDESGVQAIRSSITLFKNNWGQTVIGRTAASGSIILLYVLIGVPLTFILSIALSSLLGGIGMIIALVLALIGFLVLAIISTLADSIVNTSLYYYAKYKTIPPSYSPELLGDVFKEKKSKK